MLGIVAGLVVMIACIRKYFANLSGIDVITKKQRPQVLELQGLHEYVRHPLYSGTLLFIWSLFLVFPLLSNLIAFLIITVYVFIGIRLEERKLELEFGENYKKYARITPMLIPSFRKRLLQ
jgi:protein-S-isoprenylcysteine O-methyltransferase Ste14